VKLLQWHCHCIIFLFQSKNEDSDLKAVDVGLADFRRPG